MPAAAEAEVRRIGAMLAPLTFRLPEGRTCAPFGPDEAPEDPPRDGRSATAHAPRTTPTPPSTRGRSCRKAPGCWNWASPCRPTTSWPTWSAVCRPIRGPCGDHRLDPPALDGPQDLRHFRLAHDTEELVQLLACPSPIVLHRHQDGVALRLSWDTAQLPDVLVWISQRGRQHAPWSGRNVALGIEPCLSCFDLSRVAESPAGHALVHRRGLTLHAGQAMTLSYLLAAESVG